MTKICKISLALGNIIDNARATAMLRKFTGPGGRAHSFVVSSEPPLKMAKHNDVSENVGQENLNGRMNIRSVVQTEGRPFTLTKPFTSTKENNPNPSSPSPSKLRVRSFNLEGRGGNKSTPQGKKVEQDLRDHLNSLYLDKNTAPDVLLTQEDIDEDITGYKVVAECMAEKYWCQISQETENGGGKSYNYGDGCQTDKNENEKRMRNRVYVNEKSSHFAQFEDQSQSFIVEADTTARMVPKLTGEELQKYDKEEEDIARGAFNPRCAAIAVNKETGMAFVSFHLSGGSSDDVAARFWMKRAGQPHVPMLKRDELQLLAEYLSQPDLAHPVHSGNRGRSGGRIGERIGKNITHAIAGGDTNGTAGEQAPQCTQKYVLDEKRGQRNTFENLDTALWTKYQSLPERLTISNDTASGFHGRQFNFQRLSVANTDAKCENAKLSAMSSINGGVVDHFYVLRQNNSELVSQKQTATVLPLGLALPDETTVTEEKNGKAAMIQIQKKLSDHNPVEIEVEL